MSSERPDRAGDGQERCSECDQPRESPGSVRTGPACVPEGCACEWEPCDDEFHAPTQEDSGNRDDQ